MNERMNVMNERMNRYEGTKKILLPQKRKNLLKYLDYSVEAQNSLFGVNIYWDIELRLRFVISKTDFAFELHTLYIQVPLERLQFDV